MFYILGTLAKWEKIKKIEIYLLFSQIVLQYIWLVLYINNIITIFRATREEARFEHA